MAGPFHHDVRRDAEGQGVDDEGAATGVGADEFPLGLDLVGADVALVGGDADLFIDASEAAKLLDVTVHRRMALRHLRAIFGAIPSHRYRTKSLKIWGKVG